MRIKYSCLIDNKEKYQKQGWLWLNSLIYFGKINPSDIYMHCIGGTSDYYIQKYVQTGANVEITEAYGDKTYCNKIAQMFNIKLKDSDVIILMDTDMIMLKNFEKTLDFYDYSNYIIAKIVNAPNPEKSVIDKLFEISGLKKSLPDKIIELSGDYTDYMTYGANFNGGLYIIPEKYYDTIQSGWAKWAQWLIKNGKPLYDANKEAHIDQISFCMTIHENNLPIKYLDRLYNYPLPFDFGDPEKIPYVLHYHHHMDENNLLWLNYQPGKNMEKAVRMANEFIEKYNTRQKSDK